MVEVDREIQKYVLELVLRVGLFLVGAVVSPFVGRSLPKFFKWLFVLSQRYFKTSAKETYTNFVEPFQTSLTMTGTLAFISLCLNLLVKYEDLYTFLGVFIYLALSVSVIWFSSKIARQIIRQSVINVVQRSFGTVNEVVLVFETLIYVIIVIFAIVVFARGLRVNLIALSASLGISGIAVAFAARQALERLIGTIELYLDRPYVPGEYIKVTFNPYGEDVYGRVESIGLRSTKIRTVAQNTLIIAPNSMMASMKIENISRGKKVMAMLCLDFAKTLKDGEKSLISQVIKESTQVFWGLERTSSQIQFCQPENRDRFRSRVRIIFFITGSSDNSLELRKRLLELANETIAVRLAAYNLTFVTPEPTLYIDSPMSI